ncbi:hypothetical protein HanRHA438_Chr12g0565901 [Helianthus annuus]|uniref:Uncharacterized protein n=1 Tax=Helianthus annuus TaxID=4232 RepID=A0A9K3MX58_HELAN|nr:hypothetical protein HanXRQr2_Chr12g0554551 [Helianthus annuus]KAJ0490363.1 hypothetical protein HanHA300_Chr12g0454591 [Helianthus annuus]KAJ0494543.1 hypothetical protein HanIR_Chr12g0598661 [Helianthus annuus]KAJ0506281.1 hypothetical protein HanHA89_Chr12g0480171 [Helianthus annuus]KAJ0675953.1 hypothetical protein HanLR1_Chr12g0457091 [Helianthus annuus]
MAEPSNPLSTAVENPESSSPTAAEEEEAEVNAPGKNLPVLRWTESAFQTLMTGLQMPAEYGAMYHQKGDTVGDAPAGPLGMIRVRNFEYTFRALGIEPTVGDFRHFNQLTVQLCLFSFCQRDHATKLVSTPKGTTKWKIKFFYVKAAAVTEKLQFRNVMGTIITENISIPKAETVDWFPRLRIIGSFKLDNRQLWVLRMMIGRLDRKARPVLREKNDMEAPLWRMFYHDFEGKIEIVRCGAGEKGWNRTIISNFLMPNEATLNAVLPEGKGHLGALGDPAATGVPKVAVEKFGDKRQCKKKTHEAVSVLPLMPEAAGIRRTHLRKYENYVVVSDTLKGLGVTGASAGAGGSTACTKPVDDKKRKANASVAAGEKAPKFRKTRATVVPRLKPVVSTAFVEPREEPVPVFATPPSSPKVVDVEAQKKGGEDPSVEVVSSGGTPPSVQAEQASKKTSSETIFDTLDSYNNLIDPHDDGGQGVRWRSPLFLKKLMGLLPRARKLRISLQFSRGRLNWIIITVLTWNSGVLISTAPLEYFAGGMM